MSAPLRARVSSEPVAVGAAALALVEAVVAALVGFEVVTAAQGGLLGAVAATLVLFVAAAVRARVTPVAAGERGW